MPIRWRLKPKRKWWQIRAVRRILMTVAVLAVFSLALVLWAGGDPQSHAVGGLPDDPSATIGTPTSPGAAPPSGSGTASGARSDLPTTVPGATPPTLDPSLPNSLVANPGDLPKHAVTITVTSDGTIAGFAYAVAEGNKQKRYSATFVRSPITVQTTGQSKGLVVQVLAQAASDATYITCSVTVDGSVRTQRTVHRPKVFTACLG